jgi:hypothetical protein
VRSVEKEARESGHGVVAEGSWALGGVTRTAAASREDTEGT